MDGHQHAARGPTVPRPNGRPMNDLILENSASHHASFHRQSSAATQLASNVACHTPVYSDVTNSTFDVPIRRIPLHQQHVDEGNLQYYRIVFKGVVSLLQAPEVDAARTGFYLSYGEIVCCEKNRSNTTTKSVKVVSVLTGGYAEDASTDGNGSNPSGFLILQQDDCTIAELLNFVPIAESGTYLYKVTSTTPLPILAGPVDDAPKTKAVVLPGSVQDISLRIYVNSETWFLRLSHRRGWLADRKAALKKNAQLIPVVKEITFDSDNRSTDGSIGSTYSAATSISTRSRHRPPRRRRDASMKEVAARKMPLKQIHDSGDRSVAQSSNVSILSDDSSLDLRSRLLRPASPDTSYATIRSGGSSSNQQIVKPAASQFFLMRVTAPKGLRILDAPQFQVSNFILGGKQHNHNNNVASSHTISKMEQSQPTSHHSIFRTMSSRLTTTGPSQAGNPAVFDANSKTRLLPRGVLFEALSRIETNGAYNQGAGMIKLSDKSGWAIVPRQAELDDQYRKFTGGSSSVKEGEAMRAFEEVGSAKILEGAVESSEQGQRRRTNMNMGWVRVVSRAGVTVTCPPPPPAEEDELTSPTSSRGSSAITGSNIVPGGPIAGSQFNSADSDVASSVGSGFLDALFRTPKKKDSDEVHEPIARSTTERPLQSNLIPCGMFLQVEERASVETTTATNEYARLYGGQGWIPLLHGGKSTTVPAFKPEFRLGSFWFRVQSSRGLKVRLGPSKRAPSIKSEDNVYFRFECGEFLRASEIVTCFSDCGEPMESFAKLYRNRHVRLHTELAEFRPLHCLTTQAEWVQVYNEKELFLEECISEPRIERHKQGWRYNAVPQNGVAVRKGPSLAAEKTGIILFGGESVVINERVSPAGDKIMWLRMRDGQGWIHDVDETGKQIMIAHSLRHRALSTRPRKPAQSKELHSCDSPHEYNAIIARLFEKSERAQEGPST